METKLERDGFFPKHVQPGAVVRLHGTPVLVVASRLWTDTDSAGASFYTAKPEDVKTAIQNFSGNATELRCGWQHWSNKDYSTRRYEAGFFEQYKDNERTEWEPEVDSEKLEINDYPEFSAIQLSDGYLDIRQKIKSGLLVGNMAKTQSGKGKPKLVCAGYVMITGIKDSPKLDLQFEGKMRPFTAPVPMRPEATSPLRDKLLRAIWGDVK